jgi:predicted dehydrogenase
MYRVAIIGVGKGGEGIGGHSIGYQHAVTYRDSGGCTIIGAADISEQNLERFVTKFDVLVALTDYRTMLAETQPDIVSVAVYAGARRPIVEDAPRRA